MEMHVLSATDRELLELATAALEKAYAPYSHFRVGSALRSVAGEVYQGCNVENAAYPLGVCAERNAIAAAVVAEGVDMRIETIVIVTRSDDGPETGSCPCGGCRQVIREFSANTRVVYSADGKEMVARRIDELLPDSFHAGHL